MSQYSALRVLTAVTGLSLVSALALQGCGSEGQGEAKRQELTAACIDDADLASDEDWVCPDPFTMECTFAANAEDQIVYVTPPEGQTCSDLAPEVDAGPYAPGAHSITIRDEDAGALCSTELIVVDTAAPTMDLKPHVLWPPNHKMTTITPDECGLIVDACDPNLNVFFTSVSSNELPDFQGDGHTQPDIEVVNCSTVRIRAERSGTGDGRLYQLGVTAIDDQGLVTTGTCEVLVPHDQGPINMMPIPDPAYSVDMSECGEGMGGASGTAGAGSRR